LLVAAGALAFGPTSTCAATRMIAEARTGAVAAGTAGEHLLARASAEADAADRASDPRERQQLCINALLELSRVAPDVLGPDRGEREAARARQLVVVLYGSHVGAPAAPPGPTPAEQWEQRRRRLVRHTAASGVFTGIGLGMMTVPWIVLAAACTPESFCEGYGAIWSSGFGAPIFVASVIPLAIWSHRLRQHLRDRPPGLAVLGGRARIQLVGPGLRLDF
jgi:hypothetical protein